MSTTLTTDERTHIRVLVVDDSPDHRMLMGRTLEDAGMTVRQAASAEDALRDLEDLDLILLDYRLPRMSGLELLAMLQERVGGPSVVVVTGMGSTGVVIEAMRNGAIDYVAKEPGYLDELATVVERAWRQHDLARRTRELQRLALLVQEATGRDDVVEQIVRGAVRLFRAQSGGLALQQHGHLELVHVEGDRIPLTAILDAAGDAVGTDRVDQLDDESLVIGLTSEGEESPGVIVLARRQGGAGIRGEEVELGRAFAAFAVLALRNLRRRELEQSLIEELEQTIQARRDFISSISHELRTPLTSIGGYTETLLEHWERLEDGDKRDYLRRVSGHTSALSALIEQLMDLASLERGRVVEALGEELDLAAVVTATVESLEPLTGDRHIRLDLDKSLEVRADVSLLNRTLSNLISNAAKYSDPGTTITIATTVERDHARIEVTDEGVGIEPREANHVFEPFWRASYAVSNAVRGSGIGLALVREYVRVMGGEVGVKSEPGMGSTFWFTLPLAR